MLLIPFEEQRLTSIGESSSFKIRKHEISHRLPTLATQTVIKYTILWNSIPSDILPLSISSIQFSPPNEKSTTIRIYNSDENTWITYRKFQDSWISKDLLYNYITSIQVIKFATSDKLFIKWHKIPVFHDDSTIDIASPSPKKKKFN